MRVVASPHNTTGKLAPQREAKSRLHVFLGSPLSFSFSFSLALPSLSLAFSSEQHDRVLEHRRRSVKLDEHLPSRADERARAARHSEGDRREREAARQGAGLAAAELEGVARGRRRPGEGRRGAAAAAAPGEQQRRLERRDGRVKVGHDPGVEGELHVHLAALQRAPGEHRGRDRGDVEAAERCPAGGGGREGVARGDNLVAERGPGAAGVDRCALGVARVDDEGVGLGDLDGGLGRLGAGLGGLDEVGAGLVWR